MSTTVYSLHHETIGSRSRWVVVVKDGDRVGRFGLRALDEAHAVAEAERLFPGVRFVHVADPSHPGYHGMPRQ